MWIPGRQHGTSLDVLAIIPKQGGAVGDFMPLALAAIVVGDQDLAGTRNDDLFILRVGHITNRLVEPQGTCALRINLILCGGPRCCATDVESAHGELGAGFTD
jgi:hypothetical protein